MLAFRVFCVVLGVLLTAGPAAAAPADVRINEVVTTGSVNDSIELVNTGTAAVDLSGWVLKDSSDSSKFRIPAGTTLAAGGFRAFDVHAAFGLGSSDAARLYRPDGSLADSFRWSTHSAPSWSRCPDGTGAFAAAAVTLGGPNACAAAWPGGSAVTTADAANVFGEDLSGLSPDGGALWAVQNSGRLWRLLPGGPGWTPDTSAGWASGKALRFPGGSGSPDSEGVTAAAGAVFVASERDAAASGTSRLSVLRYDVGGTGTTLTATREWNLTADLPPVGANLGFEGLTWIPDTALTGLLDESTGAPYDPARYGPHSGGVFFAGVEGTGMIHGYVLQDSGAFTRVTSFASGLGTVMELQWEPQAARLWVVCDDTCHGEHRTMRLGASGRFATTAVYARPSGMPDFNNEGFAISDGCVNGVKPVYWADDGNDDGHALRQGTLAC
ncbi:lamin tail domain-containing protein [Amycolatopsis sp. NEAU-NG30]|uniref:Lamin tail domain-containing protein n=1 Tax=Amycolatopsis melonis TaxID=3156488 RepID=A0ABV0L749_9PSEU